MWNRLISINPNLIKFYNIQGKYRKHNEGLIKGALDNGYQINEDDLRHNKHLQGSSVLMHKAIEIDPNYIKYYRGYNEDLINIALKKGYIPTIDDLYNNNSLGDSTQIVKYLIENGHPEAIAFYRQRDEDVFDLALKRGYQIKENDLIKNSDLCSSFAIMREAIKINPNYIKYCNSREDELFSIAINNGYIPTLADLKKNYLLGYSTQIVKYLIENGHPEAIKFCEISPYENSQIYELAFSKGYRPNITDIRRGNLSRSDIFMEYLIRKDCNIILKYTGDNEKIYELAYNLGFNEKKIINSIKKSFFQTENLRISKFIMKKILDYDVTLFKKYFCKDLIRNDVIDYIPTVELKRAVKIGYIPSDEILFKINQYSRNLILEDIILNDPSYIKYYNGDNVETYLFAINKGYLPSEDCIKNNWKIRYNLDIMMGIVKLKPEYIEFFENYKLILKILIFDYAPTFYEVEHDYNLTKNYEALKKIISIHPAYIEYANISDDRYYDLLMEAIKKYKYRPSLDRLDKLKFNYDIVCELIKYDIKYVDLIQKFPYEEASKLYDIAFDLGFRPNEINSSIAHSYKIMMYYVNLDYNNIKRYYGVNIDVFKTAIKNGYPVPSLEDVKKELTDTNIILYLIKYNDFSILSHLSYFSERVMSIALKLGYFPSINKIDNYNYGAFDEELLKKIIINSNVNDCIDFVSRIDNLSNEIIEFIKNILTNSKESISLDKINEYNYKVFDEELLKKIIINSNVNDCISFILAIDNISDYIKNFIIKEKKINLSFEYLDFLKDYKYDKELFVTSYNLYTLFLKKINIKESSFIQYGFNVDYDWFSAIVNIINNDKLDEFVRIKDYFFKNVYFINDDSNDVLKMKAFMNILKNYEYYSELCINVMNEDGNLPKEIIDNIKFLFNSTDFIDFSKIRNISDLLNLKELFKEKYQNLINTQMNIDDIKDTLCKLLFNMSLNTVISKLNIYGDTKVLRQLIFNNRDKPQIIDLITEMMIYTSMMEGIVSCNDLGYLVEMGNNILNNYELSMDCMILFDQFDEKIRYLYEKELTNSLTILNDNIDGLLDKDMSNRYGVDVIDFQDKKYCLIYHVMSSSETPEELINGRSSRDKSTICLSIGSNRNQVLYSNYGIIFATDGIPDGSFIRSSISNMGSNGSVKGGSFEDHRSNQSRTQRGALEVSSAPLGVNSEVFCFRSGVKFKYIILPGGREPTGEEIEIAKKYDLKFIKTQELNKAIDNPQDIDSKYLKNNHNQSNVDQINRLKLIKDKLLTKESKRRKIAIFTDSHALFEPTLAILEDARKNGITEIYSLGDNIGTGPNPREVMELLSEYGVKSLKGNHELYATAGVDEFEKHLRDTGAYEEAKRNSSWTRSQLTPQQISEIRNNPEERIIEIGREKILLTHFTRNYNTGELKNMHDGINAVFQGHIHFVRESLDGIITLRGAGIGYGSSDKGMAYYIILTARENGGYDIEKRVIPYDTNNLKYDISESSMDEVDKSKIGSWAGIHK